LSPFVIPDLLAFAFRSPPFRRCHMLPCLLTAMVVFPLFLHIFIHVLYLTCFHHPCVLPHLARAYPVSGYAPMSPRHILTCFSFAFYLHCILCPALLHFPASFDLEFPTFSSTVSSDNMFREIPTLRRAAHHDASSTQPNSSIPPILVRPAPGCLNLPTNPITSLALTLLSLRIRSISPPSLHHSLQSLFQWLF